MNYNYWDYGFAGFIFILCLPVVLIFGAIMLPFAIIGFLGSKVIPQFMELWEFGDDNDEF